MHKTALILGATGITGRALLELLMKDNRYARIRLFSRTPIGFDHPKIEEHLINLLDLQQYSNQFEADEVFCCIGTTKRKTPDKEHYYKIDYGIPVTAARLCKTNSIQSFLVISALGANPNSSIFYNRIKGEMEKAVLEFDIPNTYILQPSLIATKRKETRMTEYIFVQLMNLINPVLIGNLKKYRSIRPEQIAKTMIWLANHKNTNTRITSDQIQEIAY